MADKNVVSVVVGRRLFSFDSKRQWIAKGQSWFRPYQARRTVTIDGRGRIMFRGADFDRAERDGAFPVTVYLAQLEDDDE